MDFILSINNREKVITLPIPPAEITLSSPQNNETFQTVGVGDLAVIGNRGLKTLFFSSFFPAYPLSYSKNNSMFGWDYVGLIEELRDKKMPFRFVVTDTGINLPVLIDTFEYGLQNKSQHIYYTLSLTEFKMIR